MFPTTPTLPTVIVTPCTPLYLLPTRSKYNFSSSSSSSSSSGSSSTRQYTRKQHLMSALELGPSLFPHPGISEEKPDYSLLLPSPINLHTKTTRRRANGAVLSLLILGVFALVLVGPMLPYRWYTGMSGAEAPALIDVPASSAAAEAAVVVDGHVEVESGAEGFVVPEGLGSAVEKREIWGMESEQKVSWRSTVMHGLEWALLD